MKAMFHLFSYRKNWIFLLAFNFLVVALLYWQTINSKFLFDWNTNMIHYLREGWSGLAYCYHDRSMRWICHIMNLLIYEIFGMNPYGWFFWTISVHAINSVLLTIIVKHICDAFELEHSHSVSILSGIVWLISPYHSEAVVWGAATLHVGIVTLILAGIICYLRFQEIQKIHYLIGVYIFYLLAMFMFENFLPFPFLLLIVFLMTLKTNSNNIGLGKFIYAIFVPMLALTSAYFITNKIRTGKWVGRYGEEAHLNTDIFLLVPNFLKYVSKLLYIPLFFTYEIRDGWYHLLSKSKIVYLSLVTCTVSFIILTFQLFAGNKWSKALIGFFALFFLALLPVINMYFPYNKDIEGDRYFYLSSTFFYTSFIFFLFYTLKRWAMVPVALVIFTSVGFLCRNNSYWSESGKLATALMNDFRWQNSNRVFVLLSPDNVKGAYCMRSMPNSTLAEMLFVQRRINMENRIIEAYQYNVNDKNDSVSCVVVDSTTLELKLTNKGSWFWRNSFGATDFENKYYKAVLDKWLPCFTITFKNKQPGDVFIYPVSDHWVEVKNF